LLSHKSARITIKQIEERYAMLFVVSAGKKGALVRPPPTVATPIHSDCACCRLAGLAEKQSGVEWERSTDRQPSSAVPAEPADPDCRAAVVLPRFPTAQALS